MAYAYDEGGAIDDTDEAPDVSQTAQAEDDATGVNQATQQQQPNQPQQDPNQSRSGLDFNAGHVAGNAKRIISYLMAADAAPPETIEQAARAVDPDGGMNPADRNLLALDRVREQSGDQAAWKLMQTHRGAYNATTAFAKTALTGNGQKPADLQAALTAANQAQAHVLDGSNIQFAQHNGLVTATVTTHGQAQPETIQLTPQQFGQFLDVGGDGQWDKVMSQSAPATLKRIAATGGPRPGQGQMKQLPQSAAPQAQQQPQPQSDQTGSVGAAQGEDDENTMTPAQPGGENLPVGGSPEALRMGDDFRHEQRLAAGGGKQPFARSGDAFPGNDMQFAGNDPADERSSRQTNDRGSEQAVPGTHDRLGHYRGPQQRDPNGYGEELENRSRSIFPGAGQEDQRQQWMAAQEQQTNKNAIDKTRAGHEWSVESSRLRADATVRAAEVKAEQQRDRALGIADRFAQNRQDKAMSERGKMARSAINSPTWMLMTDDQRNAILKKFGVDQYMGEAQPAPTGQAQPAPQAQPASSDGGPKKLYNGKLYTRQEYEQAFGKK